MTICSDPQLLVEIYLNYDCDGDSLDNIYERLVNVLSKTVSRPIVQTESIVQHASITSETRSASKQTPSLTSASLSSNLAITISTANDISLRSKSLEVLVAILDSLVEWANKGFELDEADSPSTTTEDQAPRTSTEVERPASRNSNPSSSTAEAASNVDDPEQFSSLKNKKQKLQEGIRMFAWKPKKVSLFLIITR